VFKETKIKKDVHSDEQFGEILSSESFNEGEVLRTVFPKTRYYGSKRRLVKQITNITEGLDYHTVLDPFGETATVSLLFKAMGKKVTYNDSFFIFSSLRFFMKMRASLLSIF
jgi:hypothetical protein